MVERVPEILVVEDDPADRELLETACRKSKAKCRLHCVTRAEDALSYLAQTTPALVLLDLNLPGISGQELLERIKRDASLRRIPVLILSTSSAPTDVERAYAAHANAYLVKPSSFPALVAMVDALQGFWLQHAQLAPPDPTPRAATPRADS